MGFNFTDKDLDKASSAQGGFNGGKAGVAENVKVWMEEAGVDGVAEKSNPNAPTFKVFFEDENGLKVNRACFDIKPEDYPKYDTTYAKAIEKEWAYLNKIVEHSGGTKVFDFVDDEDMFRKMKEAIGDKKVNVFVNYGSTRSPKEFLEPRKWMPAVEAAGTPASESKLKPGRIDQMSAPAPDTEEAVTDSFF